MKKFTLYGIKLFVNVVERFNKDQYQAQHPNQAIVYDNFHNFNFAPITEESKPLIELYKKYNIGYSYRGNGIGVYNSKREKHGDYETIAHISALREITWYNKKLPEIIKKDVIDFTNNAKEKPGFHCTPEEHRRKIRFISFDKKKYPSVCGEYVAKLIDNKIVIKSDRDIPHILNWTFKGHEHKLPLNAGKLEMASDYLLFNDCEIRFNPFTNTFQTKNNRADDYPGDEFSELSQAIYHCECWN